MSKDQKTETKDPTPKPPVPPTTPEEQDAAPLATGERQPLAPTPRDRSEGVRPNANDLDAPPPEPQGRGPLSPTRGSVDPFRARQAGAVFGELLVAGEQPESPLRKFAKPTDLGAAAADAPAPKLSPEEEDRYAEAFRGPFITKTKIKVGRGEYVPANQVLPGGSVPRDYLESLWRVGAVEPYVPPPPAAPPPAARVAPRGR